jgi:hypothetical protein
MMKKIIATLLKFGTPACMVIIPILQSLETGWEWGISATGIAGLILLYIKLKDKLKDIEFSYRQAKTNGTMTSTIMAKHELVTAAKLGIIFAVGIFAKGFIGNFLTTISILMVSYGAGSLVSIFAAGGNNN